MLGVVAIAIVVLWGRSARNKTLLFGLLDLWQQSLTRRKNESVESRLAAFEALWLRGEHPGPPSAFECAVTEAMNRDAVHEGPQTPGQWWDMAKGVALFVGAFAILLWVVSLYGF